MGVQQIAKHPILIAGAGIGGLSAAIALSMRGIASHVLERRDTFAEEGAGIQIGPNGMRILAKLGVADRLAHLTARPDSIAVLNGKTGRELTRLPLGAWIETRHGAPYCTAHRQDLHTALLEKAQSLPAITITTGAGVAGFQNEAGGVRVALTNGASLTGPALIAADGIWSSTRKTMAPETAVRFVNKLAYRSVVPAAEFPTGLNRNNVHAWLMPGAHAVHYPVRNGETAMVVVIDGRENSQSWSTAASRDELDPHFARFPRELRELAEAAPSWRKWALYQAPPLAAMNKDRIALLGDAAHPVLPFLAQGAVMALEDAAAIASALAAHLGNPQQALQLYSEKRIARVTRVQHASQENGSIYHLDGALAFARNAVLRTLPPALLMKRYDWLYGSSG